LRMPLQHDSRGRRSNTQFCRSESLRWKGPPTEQPSRLRQPSDRFASDAKTGSSVRPPPAPLRARACIRWLRVQQPMALSLTPIFRTSSAKSRKPPAPDISKPSCPGISAPLVAHNPLLWSLTENLVGQATFGEHRTSHRWLATSRCSLEGQN